MSAEQSHLPPLAGSGLTHSSPETLRQTQQAATTAGCDERQALQHQQQQASGHHAGSPPHAAAERLPAGIQPQYQQLPASGQHTGLSPSPAPDVVPAQHPPQSQQEPTSGQHAGLPSASAPDKLPAQYQPWHHHHEQQQLLKTGADDGSDEDPDEHLELQRTVHALQRELAMTRSRQEKDELVSSLQHVFMNNMAMSSKGRRALLNLTSAYTYLFEVPETDCSVAQADNFPWQHGWEGPPGKPSVAQGVWHAIICCNGNAEMTFESLLPGMEGHLMNIQHLMRDPPRIWMQCLKLYARHVTNFLDKARGDMASPYAHQAALLGIELAAVIICKSGRIPQQHHAFQSNWASSKLSARHHHFAEIAGECAFSEAQKTKAIKKRQLY
ncbi:hypothetical protein WJX74_002711 [Apatococcus lobatus]|uniref:Uncharacterized protein n=1 Tax=Apatococcus lobatus TaxID=904363 RepID=A0AAW1QJ34_9CHLO